MYFKKLLLIVLLLLSITLVSAGTPVASLVFSNPIVSNNLSFTNTTSTTSEAYTIQTTKNGEACRQIPLSKYAYFNVNDAAVPSTQNNLIYTITFFDEENNKINLQYNANDGSNYKSLTISQTGSNTWVTAKVAITNAALNNLQNNAADFRISASGGDVFIKEITIEIGTFNPALEPIPAVTASSYSEFLGKSVAGYQVWFVAGNATSGWTHWSSGTSGAPGQNKAHFEVCPDVSDYPDEVLKPTNFAPMGNGNPLKLFTSALQPVIDLHFKWMKEYGIDGVAVQRFIGSVGNSIIHSPNATPLKLKQAAEENGRIFYICYDISSTGLAATWTDIIKFDWVYNVEQNNNLTASPAYAKVGNKPVVQLWGPGFLDEKHPGTAAETIALIEFLQARGCYVVGGTPKGWRTNSGDAKGPTQPLPINQESFAEVYVKYNMISPWMPGRIRNNTEADNLLASTMIPDKTYCDARNIQYMPVVFPGFGWSQWNEGSPNSAPRSAGEFMWHQATNIKKLGSSNMYFAMFDEYDEGTAILKNATDWSMIPTDQYFLTSSADGIWCSSDFQLRVAGAAVEMLQGKRPATTTVPIPHSNGPVYYRNSFEKRTTPYNYLNNVAQSTGTFNIDPCFYQNAETSRINVLSPICEIQTTNPRSGLYSVKTSGTIGTTSAAKYVYKIANVKIAVKPTMKLSFWKKTETDLGRFVFVDLRSKKGVYLYNAYSDQNGVSMNPAIAHGTVGAGWEPFTCEFGNGVLLGDTITEVYVNYDGVGTGSYSAYFDDFLIEENQGSNFISEIAADKTFIVSQQSAKGLYRIKMELEGDYLLQVHTLSGVKLLSRKSNKSEETIDLSSYGSGVFILSITMNTKTYHRKIIRY